ncbi:MAG: nucleotide exchange factor GrpE [Spirochaetia bacterium]
MSVQKDEHIKNEMESETTAENGPALENQEEEALQDTEKTDKAAKESGDLVVEEKIAELEAKVKALEDENSELKNQFLRKQAEFENFRKRMQREKQEAIRFSNSQILSDLMEVIDNFERAIKSSESSRDFDAFHSGIVMIEQQFTSMLEKKYGLKRFESVGEEFDPQYHEALMMEESPEHDIQTVLEDFQKGYMLHDRVLRPAKVKVSQPGAPSAASEGEGPEDNEE